MKCINIQAERQQVLFQDTVTQAEDAGIISIDFLRPVLFYKGEFLPHRFEVDIKGPGAMSYQDKPSENVDFERIVEGRNKEGKVTGDVKIETSGFSGQIAEFYLYTVNKP